jgi:hypothetical protein
MPVSVTMPRLGESVTEGTVTRWLKQEGERVLLPSLYTQPNCIFCFILTQYH